MLEAKHLIKTYKSKNGVNVRALNDISLVLPKTGMVFILGKSGSGKSTLLNVLGGLDDFDTGDILINGESTQGFKQSNYDSYRNTYVGFIFQEYNLLDGFSVGANIGLAMELQGLKANEETINKVLDLVDLAGLGSRKTNELSGGQKQRVAIARALVKNPSIIMADEPTGALDSKTGKQVFDTLKKLSSEKLVLIVSHDRDFAEGYADRIIELADGKIISDVSKQKKDVVQDNLTYTSNGIEVKQGYVLTEEDLNQINDYLKKQSTQSMIKSSGIYRDFEFISTNSEKIEKASGGFRLIKSSLPLRTAFKIGRSSLKHKVFKLVITMFLSVQAFTLFGLADTVAAYKERKTTIASLSDSNIDFLTLSKKKYTIDIEDKYEYYDSRQITDEDLSFINENNEGYFKGVYAPTNSNLSISSYFGNGNPKTDEEESYISGFSNYVKPNSLSGLVNFTKDDLKEYGYTLSAGSLPADDSQVAVSEYMFNCFKQLGYVDSTVEPSITYNISNYSDLIGKALSVNDSTYTISGIINTNFDLSRYETMIKEGQEESTMATAVYYYVLGEELSSAKSYSLINVLFVNDGYIEKLIDSKKTSFVISKTYDIGFQGEGTWWYNTPRIEGFSPISKTTCNIDYFGENKTIDDTHIAVNLNMLVLMNGSDYYDETTFATLGQEYVIGDDTYNSADFIDYLYYDSTVEAGIYNILFKTVLEELQSNTEAFKQTLQDVFGKTNLSDIYNISDKFRSYLNGRTSAMDYVFERAETRIAKELYSDLKKINVDLGKSRTITYSYNSKDKTYPVEIIGIATKTKYTGQGIVWSDALATLYSEENVGVYSFAVSNMPKSKSDIAKAYDFTQLKTNKDNNTYIRYTMENSVVFELDTVGSLLQSLKKIFLYVGLFFAVFSGLLLANFIATSISYKKKDIGILRAIGSRSSDVFKIFFAESFIISMIDFGISCILTLGISIAINHALRASTGLLLTILTFGIRQVVIVLLASLFVAAVATFLPVNKTAKKKPVAAIRNSI